MKAPARVGSPLGKPAVSAKAEGVLEVILGGGVTLEEADCLELVAAALVGLVLAAAVEAEDWSDVDEEAADAEVEVASEAEGLGDVAVGPVAVGIALLVEPVSCGRFPCAIAMERMKPVAKRKSIISEDADERREDRILVVVQAVWGPALITANPILETIRVDSDVQSKILHSIRYPTRLNYGDRSNQAGEDDAFSRVRERLSPPYQALVCNGQPTTVRNSCNNSANDSERVKECVYR